MNLNDEERQVGRENFCAAIGAIRRDMLQETVDKKLASKNGLGSQYFKYGAMDEPLRIGIIGTGDEGGVLIGSLNPKYVQVVAIADIRPYNVYRALHGDKSSPNAEKVRPGLMKIYGWPDEKTARENVKIYEKKYEELLDDPNVEAVIVALPLHLHAEASIKAMRKGKHVLCEKLMAHDIHQCKEMARVATETNKLLAIGHQRHYSVLYDNAVEMLRKGVIGDIHHIRAQWHRGNLPGNDSWQQPLPDEKMQAELEKAKKDLANAEKKLAKAKEEAKKRIKDEKQLKQLATWDHELKVLPERIVKWKEQLVAEPAPDEETRKKLLADIAEKEKRVAAVSKEYLKRIKLDPQVAKALDPIALVKQVEILSNRLRDASIAVACQDYGYQERVLGGKTISALEELIRWRLWARTGGGLMAELGSHQMDAAGIFISSMRDDGQKVLPLSVAAVGGRHIFPHDRDIEDHVYCSFEYPGPGHDQDPEKKIVVSYSSINGNGFGGYGEMVFGTQGTLLLDREKHVMLFKGASTTQHVRARKREKTIKVKDAEGNEQKVKKVFYDLVEGEPGGEEALWGKAALTEPISRGYTEEIEHWAWAVRAGTSDVPPRCGPKVALADAVIALCTNLVMRAGEMPKGKERDAILQAAGMDHLGRLKFNPAWFDPDSDETPEGVKPDTNRTEYKV